MYAFIYPEFFTPGNVRARAHTRAHAHTVARYIMCALTLASTILKCVLHEHPLRTSFSGHGGLHPSSVTVHEA